MFVMIKFNAKKIYKVTSILGIIIFIIICFILYKTGIFHSIEKMKKLVEEAGVLAPILFIIIQIIQVVIPIIPGGITLLVGVIVFGSFWGFIYNYIGIVVGSILAFLLARKLGKPFLENTFSKQYKKYGGWLEKGKIFERMFTIAILLPIAPDDFLCMLAGLSKMSLKKMIVILILCKPPAILAYSFGLSAITSWLY